MVSENLDFANMTNGIHSGSLMGCFAKYRSDAGWLHDSE